MRKQRKKTQKERKKKEREEEEEEEEEEGDQLKTQAAPDPGRRHRLRSRHDHLGRATTTQVAARDPGRCAANPGRASGFFFFFFLSSPMKTLVLPLWFFFVFFLNGNRVLETRFPCRHHLKKVPRKRHATHKNRALKTRFRSPKSSL